MSLRLVAAGVVLTVGVLVVASGTAWAQDNGGQNGTTSASASTSPGAVQVSVGVTGRPSAGSTGVTKDTGAGGKTNQNQPYGCTYQVLGPGAQQLLGVGGPTPGRWVIPTCSGPGVINPMPPFWVTQAKTAAPVNPAVVARQAVSKLPLPSPTIEMAPPAGANQLVNVAAWLWIPPGAWRGLSAVATAGPVTATATATPTEVVWDMGDGHRVTCAGPGTPYDRNTPNAATSCSYTWTQSSAGQPGGVYQVTATVYWQVAWTAVGAPGGGSLGLVPGPASHVAVAVAESEALNTAPGPGGG